MATGTQQKGEREGVPDRLSVQPVALTPSPKPFCTWGLRQLWSKVNPLKQLGAHVWPQLTEDRSPGMQTGNCQWA